MRFRFWATSAIRTHTITIALHDLRQLFNLMDPSPFYEKDLDPEAADYIASWADEYHIREPLRLAFRLERATGTGDPQAIIESAVHTYFAARASGKRLEFRRLMREGQKSLLIGILFLGACVLAAQGLSHGAENALRTVFRESLLVAGWVAMWRPLQIYLYEWWPIRRRRRLYAKLATAPVSVQISANPDAPP